MGIEHGNITATTTPQAVHTADGDGTYIVFHNDDPGTAVVRLGTATISTSEGFHLDAKDTLGAIRLGPNETLYVVAETGTVACSWLVHSN